ncbi:TPA: hypothetical protein ACQJMO_000829 [Klebsiella quasipneumoniae]
MTKSTITRERAQQIFLGNGPEPSASEERELARMTLAAMDGEPHTDDELSNLLWYSQEATCHSDPNYFCEFQRLATPGFIASIIRELQERLKADSEQVALQPELAKVIYHFRDWNEGFPVERFKADYVISWMLANYPPAQPAPVVPDGYVMVPMRLTADNGAKGALSGEFSETKFVNCPECFGDDECETCDGSGRIEITVPVTWTTIKEI